MPIGRLQTLTRCGWKFRLFAPMQVQLSRFSCLHSFSVGRSKLNGYYDFLSQHKICLNQRRSFAVRTEILETLGESITSAVLVSWSKEPGDSVREDDVIAIVETDKVTMDIKAKKNGVFIEGL